MKFEQISLTNAELEIIEALKALASPKKQHIVPLNMKWLKELLVYIKILSRIKSNKACSIPLQKEQLQKMIAQVLRRRLMHNLIAA